LVERSVDPTDARAVVVAATDAGRETLESLREAYRSILGEALRDWNEDDLNALTALLGRLAAALESAASTASPSDRTRAEVVR
jgi:DNA-binding MarR family transcriptional regulator